VCGRWGWVGTQDKTKTEKNGKHEKSNKQSYIESVKTSSWNRQCVIWLKGSVEWLSWTWICWESIRFWRTYSALEALHALYKLTFDLTFDLTWLDLNNNNNNNHHHYYYYYTSKQVSKKVTCVTVRFSYHRPDTW